jgi:hypothetical protein
MTPGSLGLPEKMVAVHHALADAAIHHAFGGALALAWCTQRARGTILNTTAFHEAVADRVRWEPFADHELPFLSCDDLAVFKAFFNRTKDWADLEEMRDAGTLDIATVAGVLVHHLGADDERIARLRSLAS